MVSSAAGLIITVTDGAGEVIKREAGCTAGLGPVAHDGGRSFTFCATATSASGWCFDLIRRCPADLLSGGVANLPWRRYIAAEERRLGELAVLLGNTQMHMLGVTYA